MLPDPSRDPDRTAAHQPAPEQTPPETMDLTGAGTNPPTPATGTSVRGFLDGLEDLAKPTDAPTSESGPPAPTDAGWPSVPGYAVTGEIARGGMGRVYAAHDLTLEREVAIKTLLPGANADRFVTESKVTARLPHPGIPPVYALGTLNNGAPYLAMKLIRGRTLAVLLKERTDPQADLPRFVQVFEQIAQAVGFAHSRGILHRDLKPLNVMVGEFGEVQVMDWGLAKDVAGRELDHTAGFAVADSGEHTAAGTVMGTPGYMAPEQARGEAVDARADVFALGSVLATVLTGKPAFVGTTARETIGKAASADLEDVYARLDACGADAELVALARRCLSAAPADRPADGRAVAAEVGAYRVGVEERLRQAETDRARAETQAAEQRKRRRVVQWAGGLIAAVLLLGVIGTTIGLVQANTAKTAAEIAADNERTANTKAQTAKTAAEIAADRERKAAAKEKEANEKTQRRLTQIEKGVEQFAGLLTGLDPTAEAKGGDPLYDQLRQRAEKLADELDAEAVGDAEAVARLQAILGHTLQELGNAPKAVELLEKARATLERERGPVHPYTLAILINLAGAYQAAGRTTEAIAVCKQVREALVKKFGPEHPGMLTTLNILAGAYHAAGRTTEAISLFEQVREAQTKKLGPEHPSTLITLNNLALAYNATGRTTEAIPLYKRVSDAHTKKLGLEHPSTLTTLNNLAGAYYAAGNTAEASALFEQVREAQTKKLGPEHPATLATINNLAGVYYAAGKTAEAIVLYEQVQVAFVKKLGPEHPSTLTTINNLAEAYGTVGRTAEAISLFEQVREAQTKKLGPEHPATLTTINNLARVYQATGRTAEAIALYEQVRVAFVKKLGLEHPSTLTTINNLAGVYYAAGKTAEAIALYEQIREAQTKKLGPEHPNTLTILNNLAVMYGTVGKIAEGIALHERVRDAQTRKLGPEHPNTLDTLYNLAVMYGTVGRTAEAIALLKRVRDARTRVLGPEHPSTLDTLHYLGKFEAGAGDGEKATATLKELIAKQRKRFPPGHPALAGLLASHALDLLNCGQHATAEEMLRECLTIRQKTQPDLWSTFNAQSMLGGALLGQKKYADAEPLLLKGYEGMKAREKTIPTTGGGDLRIPEALDRLVALYAALGKADDLKKWRAERAKYPPPTAPPPRPVTK